MNIKHLERGLLEWSSGKDGPLVGVVANVHGDEPVGRRTVQSLVRQGGLEAGRVWLFNANPAAGFIGQRYIDENLNRIFDNMALTRPAKTYEAVRAQDMLPYLRRCDYIIDLHSTSSNIGEPFILYWPGSEGLAQLSPAIRTVGWQGRVEGTLVEYLSKEEKIPAIVLEAGQHEEESTFDYAHRFMDCILSALGLLTATVGRNLCSAMKSDAFGTFRVVEHRHVEAPDTFRYELQIEAWQHIKPGAHIATDSKGKYLAPDIDNLRIIMPASEISIRSGKNEDAYFLVEKIGDAKVA